MKTNKMKNIKTLAMMLMLPIAAFGIDNSITSCTVTTNLNDALHTEITYDTNQFTNLDVKAVEKLSIDVDQIVASTFRSKKMDIRSLQARELRPRDLNASITKTIVDIYEIKSPSIVDFVCNNMQIANIQMHEAIVADAFAIKDLAVADIYSTATLIVDERKFNICISAEVYDELQQLKKAHEFNEEHGGELSQQLKDLQRLYGFSDTRTYIKWIKKLNENSTLNIAKIKPSFQFKLVGEAWIFEGRWNAEVKENLAKNLAWLKQQGYNAVLVRFDCTEKLNDVLQLVQMIKDQNMKVFSVYVGQDNTHPRWNPYIDPEKLEPFFKTVIAASDGLVLNWRETSTHVRLMPKEFFNYLCKIAREANPNVLIYGEVYFGVTSSSAGQRALYYNIPENATGIIVQNMGFSGYNHGYIVQQLFKNVVPNYKSLDKVFQVIGICPYYKTKNGHGNQYIENLTLEEEYRAKHEIEQSFKKYGVKTITMIHDGVDDNFTLLADPSDVKRWNNTTDNLLYDTTLVK